MAHPKHKSVRERYQFRCGYCGVSDIDAGGELTVDHFQPTSAGGDEGDDNLVYVCSRCNLYKSDYWPTAKEIAAGHFVLHPLRDSAWIYIRDNKLTGELVPLSETGRFHIAVPDLNRPQLILHRQRSKLQLLTDEVKASLSQEVAELKKELQALSQYVRIWKRRLGYDPIEPTMRPAFRKERLAPAASTLTVSPSR